MKLAKLDETNELNWPSDLAGSLSLTGFSSPSQVKSNRLGEYTVWTMKNRHTVASCSRELNRFESPAKRSTGEINYFQQPSYDPKAAPWRRILLLPSTEARPCIPGS